MNTRIRELRKYLNLTMEQFGEKIGVSKATISNIENNNRNATEHMIKSICREFGADENWLRTGEGSMFAPEDRQMEIAKLTKQLLDEESDSFKNRFVSILSKLSEEQWKMLEDMANTLANSNKD